MYEKIARFVSSVMDNNALLIDEISSSSIANNITNKLNSESNSPMNNVNNITRQMQLFNASKATLDARLSSIQSKLAALKLRIATVCIQNSISCLLSAYLFALPYLCILFGESLKLFGIGIGTVLLIVICQFLYCSLSMLAAGEMC